MDNSEITESTILAMKSESSLKKYFCPHCNEFLFKGNVKNLNMQCHYCRKLINADENEFVKPETE